MSKISRNDPCPCGSGKKYKKCCLQKSFTPVGKEESIKQKLVQDILKFLRKKYDDRLEDASDYFWDDFDPNKHPQYLQMADINFWEWLIHDYTFDEENEKTLIDLFMENNRRLTLDEHNVLTKMKNAVISLYEVQEVFPDEGLLLKDLVMGGEYDVKEKAATKSLRKWDIFGARLLQLDGQYIMSGAVYPYPIKVKEYILGDINFGFERYQKEHSESTMDEYLKKQSDSFNFYWCDLIQNPRMPKLATTTGEPMLISKAIFETKDKDAAMAALQNVKEFEEDGEGFVWLDKRNKEGSATVLGTISISDEKLTLECASKKRLERGKKLILKSVPDATHKIDSYEDPVQAMKSLKDKPARKPTTEIPMELQQELYAKFMEKHCRKWIRDKIPALDGKTPKQAVQSTVGKEKVRELLKSFENSEEHNKRDGRPFYDLSWMWDELGIDRED